MPTYQEIILVLAYSAIFISIVRYSNLFKNNVLNKNALSVFLFLKILAGTVYIYIYQHYYGGGDSISYFTDSLIIHETLYKNPLYYLFLVFGPNNLQPIPSFIEPYAKEMGFWGDCGTYMVIRIQAIVQMFSMGNYLVHAVFTAFIGFCGLFFIFKILIRYNTQNNWYIAAALFLTPSIVFWTADIHKESLLIFSMGLMMFYFDKIIENKRRRKQNFIFFLIGSLLTFVIREYIFYLLLPALIAYFWSTYNTQKTWIKFLAIYGILIIGILLIHFIVPSISPVKVLAQKQSDFAFFIGDSNVEVLRSNHSLLNLVGNLPKAIYYSLFQPMPWQSGTFFQQIVSWENFIIALLSLIGIVYFIKSKHLDYHPILYFSLFFSLSLLLTIGLVVPNLGAIARYKSIALVWFWPMILSFLPKYKIFKKFTLLNNR